MSSVTADASKATEATPATKTVETVAPAEPVKVQQETAADTKVARAIFKMKRQRVVIWTVNAAAIVLLGLAALTGTLLATDVWVSWIWVLPVIALVIPVVYELVRKRKSKRPMKRWILFIAVPAILFVGFLLIVFSGVSDIVFAATVGNETFGTSGIWLAVSSFVGSVPLIGGLLAVIVMVLGILTNVAAVFIIPAMFFVALVRRMLQLRMTVGSVIPLAILTSLMFIFPIGQSIVINSGF